jgi:hypothetical protein
MPGGTTVSEFVKDAPGSFSVFKRDRVLELFKGFGERSAAAIKALAAEPNIALAWFSFSPEDSSKEIVFFLGLDDASFAVVENDLRAAMTNGENVFFQAYGALCGDALAGQSYQRTVEQFELGHALALFEPTLRIVRKEMSK